MDLAEQTTATLASRPVPPTPEEPHFTPPGAPARVTALVVNFNTRERVEECLAALRRAAVAGGLQVVVVDNASGDGSAAAVRAAFPDVELIANAENQGYAAANNQAFARATAPYLLLLNPDTAVEPEAPEQMAAFLDAHPDAAAVTANLVAEDGSARPYVHDFPTVLTLLLKETALSRLFPGARDRLLAAYEMRGRLPDAVAPVPQPPGACLMLRRSALDGALFDERFPLYFNDVDLCRRLHRRGEIYFLPAARVRHERGEGGLNRAPETAMLEHAVSAVRYFRKHHGLLPAAALYLGLGAEFAAKATHSWISDFGFRISDLGPGVLNRMHRTDRIGRHEPSHPDYPVHPVKSSESQIRNPKSEIRNPRGRAPFRGTPAQNLGRLARFLCDISYFERRAAGPRSHWRRFLLRFLEADLWSG